MAATQPAFLHEEIKNRSKGQAANRVNMTDKTGVGVCRIQRCKRLGNSFSNTTSSIIMPIPKMTKNNVARPGR
eukprot:scaffold1954_cov153-Amphora_coffeaeformis.AAC.2